MTCHTVYHRNCVRSLLKCIWWTLILITISSYIEKLSNMQWRVGEEGRWRHREGGLFVADQENDGGRRRRSIGSWFCLESIDESYCCCTWPSFSNERSMFLSLCVDRIEAKTKGRGLVPSWGRPGRVFLSSNKTTGRTNSGICDTSSGQWFDPHSCHSFLSFSHRIDSSFQYSSHSRYRYWYNSWEWGRISSSFSFIP